jgi:GT2 family glycosyltransferase
MSSSATVIVPTVSPALAARLLESLSRSGGGFETIVVDNGTGAAELDRAASGLEGTEVMRLETNLGYGRAINLAARRAQGRALVLLNDDSTVEPGYVEHITSALDPGAGVPMAAGVMRDARHPDLIETAGIELDRTLMAFDHLNGEPVKTLEGSVPDPFGPSGAAAAFDREAFLEAGGFDEGLFAYLEDVDLALRLRCTGASCRLAKDARGTHEHSGTLGPGSKRKDYLMGYGRGYLLRKWGVVRPRRVPSILVREVGLSAAQAIFDRNLQGARGRWRGFREASPTEAYPPSEVLPTPPSLGSTMRRRRRRRARLRRKSE